jgi:hypothetical protein
VARCNPASVGIVVQCRGQTLRGDLVDRRRIVTDLGQPPRIMSRRTSPPIFLDYFETIALIFLLECLILLVGAERFELPTPSPQSEG